MKMASLICKNLFQMHRSVPLVQGSVFPGSVVGFGLPISRWISTSPCLYAEPLKKKKKLDPAVIKAREDRKKKKIEKQIRRLEKHARQFKPIEELEVPLSVVDNYKQRERRGIQVSPEEEERSWLLQKEWTRYMFQKNSKELRMIDRILASQHKALEELRLESEELYQAALQVDFSYVPCELKGPVETPPINDFTAAEGDFINVSKKWE